MSTTSAMSPKWMTGMSGLSKAGDWAHPWPKAAVLRGGLHLALSFSHRANPSSQFGASENPGVSKRDPHSPLAASACIH